MTELLKPEIYIPDDRPRSKLVDVNAAAEALCVTPRFIRRLVAEQRIPFLKIGKFIRFDPNELADWLDCQRFKPG